jgi:hypothetical protein
VRIEGKTLQDFSCVATPWYQLLPSLQMFSELSSQIARYETCCCEYGNELHVTSNEGNLLTVCRHTNFKEFLMYLFINLCSR